MSRRRPDCSSVSLAAAFFLFSSGNPGPPAVGERAFILCVPVPVMPERAGSVGMGLAVTQQAGMSVWDMRPEGRLPP